MKLTLNQIMARIASTVNLDADAPSTTSSEWSLWLAYVNRAVQEWSEAYDWEEMRKTYWPASVSGATIALPADFKKLSLAPRLHNAGDTEDGTAYPTIPRENRAQYNSSDNYTNLGGNISDGYYLTFHPITLSSGASLEIQYFSMPTSMASPSDVAVVTDSQFIIDRTVAYIFESRSDPRFQLAEEKARERLLMMIENSNLSKYNGYEYQTPVSSTLSRMNFRVGID